MKKTTDCIVIKKIDYKDSDKIVTFVSKDLGKITAIGKHAKKSIKRNLNLLDFGYLLSVVLNFKEEKSICFIEKIEVKEKFIKELNYIYLLLISLLNELLNSVIYAQEDSREVFHNISDFYRALGEYDHITEYTYKSITLPFFLTLLGTLGYNVLIDKCINCGLSGEFLNYSLEKAGFLCNKCSQFEKSIKIYKGTLKTIKNIEKTIKIPEIILNQIQIIFFSSLKNIITENNFKNILKLYRLTKDEISKLSI